MQRRSNPASIAAIHGLRVAQDDEGDLALPDDMMAFFNSSVDIDISDMSIILHGNWCGPQGSHERRICGDKIECDKVDTACHRHDKCYDECGSQSCICDLHLINEMARIFLNFRSSGSERKWAGLVGTFFVWKVAHGLCNPICTQPMPKPDWIPIVNPPAPGCDRRGDRCCEWDNPAGPCLMCWPEDQECP